jgi:uncharacterized protein DUF4190
MRDESPGSGSERQVHGEGAEVDTSQATSAPSPATPPFTTAGNPAPVSTPGPGWWQASDGNWYPPEQHPQFRPPPPSAPPTGSYVPGRYGPGQPYAGPVVQPTRTNGKAIASLVLSLVWVVGLTSILAVIFGFIAKREIRDSRGAQSGDGLATAGIVIGFVGIAGLVLFIVSVALLGSVATQNSNAVASCEADAKSVEIAADAYQAQTGTWPQNVAALVPTYLSQAPSSSHYTIFIAPSDGTVYVYPPNTPEPSSFSASNSLDNGACASNVQP